jgi:hypothetical protein
MILLSVCELLVGHLQFSPGSIERDHRAEVSPEMGWRAHVAMNIDDFMILVHNLSPLQ